MSITFDQVTKKYGDVVAVDRLSLETRDGELVVLLGPSGCGKSTSLRMLAGLEEITSGNILIGGERVNDVPPQRRDLAMVFQNYALYPHMTVGENIKYPLKVRNIEPDESRRRVLATAEMLGISSLLDRKPRQLSGGERQRVALARAIVRQPRAYLMDEPLSNLDAMLRVYMRGELKRLQRELGTTTIYVTHDQAEAMTLADRLAILRGGRLQQFDTPMNIYNRPAHKFVAEFVGTPGMNFIEGHLDKTDRRFASNGFVLELVDEEMERLKKAQSGLVLGIRPEYVRVMEGPGEGRVPARIHVTELMGNETLVFLMLAGQKVVARAPADFRAEIDTEVWIELDRKRMHFFDRDSGELLSGEC